MTELTVQPQNGKSRLTAPRVDLTPMVDLAFLLITFFLFNTTLTNPTAMTTILPADSKDSSKVAASGAVSIIAGKENMLVYNGSNMEQIQKISYANTHELRTALLSLQQQLIRKEGNDDKLFVMIKPTDETAFQHVVDLLDEMKICMIKRYTLTDATEPEISMIAGL
jgi:biopolymer transport protein ExbD